MTCTCPPVRSFTALGPSVCLSLSFVGAVRRSTVVGGVLVAGVVAGWSLAFVGQSFVGCWPSLSSVHAVIKLWGGGGSFVAGVCLWWGELRDVACG